MEMRGYQGYGKTAEEAFGALESNIDNFWVSIEDLFEIDIKSIDHNITKLDSYRYYATAFVMFERIRIKR